MKRIFVIWIALAGLAIGQEQKAEDAGKTIVRIIPIQYANVTYLANLLSLPGVRVSVKADPVMHQLVISGAPDALATVEELVKKLDQAASCDSSEYRDDGIFDFRFCAGGGRRARGVSGCGEAVARSISL